MSIVGAILVPHPPLILPEVGRGEEKIIEPTIQAYKQAANFVAHMHPETIVLSSPHSIMYTDYLHISPGTHAQGDMASFRAPNVQIECDYDQALSQRICDLAEENHLPAGYLGQRDPSLDHGTMVPLYFVKQKYPHFKLVRLGISGISLAEHYHIGLLIQQAAKELDRRIVYIASGDLSHKLKADGPYGFDSHGPIYDEKVMDVCRKAAFDELLTFDSLLLQKAAECGHRSFVIMAGALDRCQVEAHVLSHQDVTGVGYGVATFKVLGKDPKRNFLDQFESEEKKRIQAQRDAEDAYAALARKTVESYITHRTVPSIEGLPQDMLSQRAGVFCSIHKDGRLRGCIGTIGPTKENIAQEIIANAISAATQDPRFDAIRKEELNHLSYSVDVLSPPENITSSDQLDVHRYGVIVTQGHKRGLLLPNLDGVDTISQQIEIAKRKAGIWEDDPVELQRFEVVRHT